MSASNVIPLARYLASDERARRAMYYQTIVKYCGDTKKYLAPPSPKNEEELVRQLAAALS